MRAEGVGRSRLLRCEFALLGLCALVVSACDAPAPATAPPSFTPSARRDKPRVSGAAPAPEQPKPLADVPAAEKPKATEQAPTSSTSKSDSVVTASVTVDRPKLAPGDIFTLRIDVHIEPEWHIYAIDRPTDPAIPTAIKVQLPKTLAWDGDWTRSEPTLDDAHPDEPSFIYAGSASFSRRVRVAKDAPPGTLTIAGSLHYQACNRSLCRAPTQVPLQTQITIAP